MKMDTFNELKKESFKKPVFLVMIDGKNIVCDNVEFLPFLDDKTLGQYIAELDIFYSDKCKALEDRITKLEMANKELLQAIKSLNK